MTSRIAYINLKDTTPPVLGKGGWGERFASLLQRELFMLDTQPADLEDYAETNGIDIYIFSVQNARRPLQQLLDACRELRIPYIILTDTMRLKPLHRLLCPVSRLEEEVYKAEIIKHLATYTGAQTYLLQAHDYGSAAERNTNKIRTTLQHFDIEPETLLAQKDSDHLMQEAVDRQKDFLSDMIILTASRDYGLDDILFGPPERHALQRATVPIMLINPRGDLFSLCD